MLYTDRIRALREDHDYNQTQIAEAIHVAQTTYSDYEKGYIILHVCSPCNVPDDKLRNPEMGSDR